MTAGVGLGYLPSYLAMTVPGLVRVPGPTPLLREIWMGVHRDSRHTPRILAVQEAIMATVTGARDRLVPFSGEES